MSTSATTAPAAQEQAAAAPSPAEAARALRHKRARKLLLGLATWVLLPTLLSVIYLGLIASPQYESVASFALRGPDAAADAAMLREFIASREALKQLDAGGKLRAHYAQHGDMFGRLDANAGDESLFQYYRGKVDTSYDSHAGVLSLRMRAFSSKAAQQFNEALVRSARALLDRMGQQAAAAQIAATEQEVARAKAELEKAHRELAMLDAGGATDAPTRGQLEALRLDKALAERSYESALNALEGARAQRAKHTQLLMLASPSAPEQATHPRRAYGILTTFFVALALFGIIKLLVSAVREHAHI